MPKQIVFIADGIEAADFDEVACWPKQWFPDGAYEVDTETTHGRTDRHRIVVTPNTDLPAPDSEVYGTVEIGVNFLDGSEVVAALRDTVRPPGPVSDDEEACDPACVG